MGDQIMSNKQSNTARELSDVELDQVNGAIKVNGIPLGLPGIPAPLVPGLTTPFGPDHLPWRMLR
jgi:hypothetical protein